MPYIGNTVQTQGFTPAIDYFSGNGVTVTFTLSRPVASVTQMVVVIDNVIQNPSFAFTVAGNAITFTSAPLSGTNNIWVEYTSLITTYAAISQDPTVIGDITTTGGGLLSTGDFGNSYIAGTIVDYVSGNGRITTAAGDGLTIYNGGPSARSRLLTLASSGALGVGSSPSYGTSGQLLTSAGSGSAPTWTSLPLYSADYLVVAGGGGGGAGHAGGGGAGGYISSVGNIFTSGTSYAVTVGAGGSRGLYNSTSATNGANSVFSSSTAIGGGYGGGNNPTPQNGNSGGSGGGGANSVSGTGSGGSGTSGQGNAGGSGSGGSEWAAGGGGGASAAGQNNLSTTQGGAGGNGTSWLNGTTYAGGGGGGGANGDSGGGAGGSGGGGAGRGGGASGTAGTANTGGGGGGARSESGGNGGSGVVIIRYAGSTRGSGGTITSSGGYTYHTFTSSGTYIA